MRTTVRQLAASVSSDTDNAANFQFVKRAVITAVSIDAALNSVTDNDAANIEISFFPTYQGATNDVNGPICTARGLVNLLTSGMYLGRIWKVINGIAIPVEPGMRCYLNVEVGGSPSVNINAQVYVTTPT